MCSALNPGMEYATADNSCFMEQAFEMVFALHPNRCLPGRKLTLE